MNATKLSLSLTRWHKVADRIRTEANELKAKNIAALMAGDSMDNGEFEVRRDALAQNAADAVTKGGELYFQLQDTLFKIRSAVAAANANPTIGVSVRLNEMERWKQRVQYLTEVCATFDDALSAEQFGKLVEIRKGDAQAYLRSSDVTFVAQEEQTRLRNELAEARRKMNEASDSVAEANATKIAIEIDDRVVALVGL